MEKIKFYAGFQQGMTRAYGRWIGLSKEDSDLYEKVRKKEDQESKETKELLEEKAKKLLDKL